MIYKLLFLIALGALAFAVWIAKSYHRKNKNLKSEIDMFKYLNKKQSQEFILMTKELDRQKREIKRLEDAKD